jgi:hypothetical protein
MATDCEGCGANTFFDSAYGGCVSCPKNSIGLNATSADECTCLQGFYQSYNTKAYGGEMSYSEGEANHLYRNHVFRTGEGELTVVKPVMLEMSCSDDAGNSVVLMRQQYDPGTYPVKFSDQACRVPFVISYEVDGYQDPLQTSTYFQCNGCRRGYFSPVLGADACQMCLPGTYQSATGQTGCVPCGAGNISGDAADHCTPCPPESYQVWNDCQACPAGKHTVNPGGGATECVACPPNTWSDANTDSAGCQRCPPWSTSPGGTGPLGCMCASGLYMYQSPGGDLFSCMMCAAGKYSSGKTNTCIVCPSGTYSEGQAAAACTPCPPGTYGTATGFTSASQCALCPANKVCPDPSTMEPCPVNTYSLPGATSMKSCVCNVGFDCTYTKAVKGKVVLPFAPEEFDDAKRQSFINAMAAAAGVSPDRIRIISVAKYMPSVGTREAGKRRGAARTQVQIRVTGAQDLRDVDKTLARFGFPRAMVKLSRDHHVYAHAARRRGWF